MAKLTLLWVSVLFLSSCGKSFEKEAEQHLDKIIEDRAINPKSLKFIDYKVIHSDDSIYMASFIIEGKNSFGGQTSDAFGYMYVKDGEERYFFFDKVKEATQIVECANKSFDVVKDDSTFIGTWSTLLRLQVVLFGEKVK